MPKVDLPPMPASEMTDEGVYRDRRRLLRALAASPAVALAGCTEPEAPGPVARVTPDRARSGHRTDEPLATNSDVTTYNNFHEFGTGKADPSRRAETLRTDPWSVAIGGHCAKRGRIGFEDLLRGFKPEERVYGLRCVEGRSMIIPWLGLPLADVLRRFEPTSKARYVAFTTLAESGQMPGLAYPVARLAAPRGPAHRRGDASAHPARDRPLGQAAAGAERHPSAARGAVEVRL